VNALACKANGLLPGGDELGAAHSCDCDRQPAASATAKKPIHSSGKTMGTRTTTTTANSNNGAGKPRRRLRVAEDTTDVLSALFLDKDSYTGVLMDMEGNDDGEVKDNNRLSEEEGKFTSVSTTSRPGTTESQINSLHTDSPASCDETAKNSDASAISKRHADTQKPMATWNDFELDFFARYRRAFRLNAEIVANRSHSSPVYLRRNLPFASSYSPKQRAKSEPRIRLTLNLTSNNNNNNNSKPGLSGLTIFAMRAKLCISLWSVRLSNPGRARTSHRFTLNVLKRLLSSAPQPDITCWLALSFDPEKAILNVAQSRHVIDRIMKSADWSCFPDAYSPTSMAWGNRIVTFELSSSLLSIERKIIFEQGCCSIKVDSFGVRSSKPKSVMEVLRTSGLACNAAADFLTADDSLANGPLVRVEYRFPFGPEVIYMLFFPFPI